MTRAGNGGTIVVVAVVLMAALSGCAGWGADGPADDGVAEGENGPEGTEEETIDEGDDGEQEPAVEEDAADDDDPPNPGSASDDEPSNNGNESDADGDEGDEGESTDAENDTTDAAGEDDGANGDGDEADEPAQEYDAGQFTFVEIFYEDAEERPPNSVELLNSHERSIDLSGWAVTTTEGGSTSFPRTPWSGAIAR